tara:strand:+ start:658 stop:1515 length:858 start_codon:yes stop_codon:yes gene_type:complete
MSTKRAKHNKIRNTGLLFEFLLRQVTADVLEKTEKCKALNIIKKRFNENTELGQERALYSVLVNTKFNTDKKAAFFIEEVIKARHKLNISQLKREKFNLIKEIKNSYDLNQLLSSKVPDYKIYASIYKLFEHQNILSPEDKTESYFNLVENITSKKNIKLRETIDPQLPDNVDLRIISYRILLEKFNQKYSYLDGNQKNLLKEYINNVSNTNSLTEYVENRVSNVKKSLKKYISKVDDKVTKIKLKEAINSIDKFCRSKGSRGVPDSAIIQLMRYYELVKELKKV